MKKTLLVLLLSLGFLVPSFGQSTGKKLSPEAENFCTELTRSMATKIQLNEAEFIALKSLNREMILKSEEITTTYQNDAATREKKMKEAMTSFNEKIKPILKPYQLQSYSTIKLNADTWLISAVKDSTTTNGVN